MQYCVLCLYPSTKPELKINLDGVCSACFSYAQRAEIDWVSKEKQFSEIIKKHKKKMLYMIVLFQLVVAKIALIRL